MGRTGGDPHPHAGNPQMEAISQAQRSSTRSEESEPQMGSPAQGSCTGKMSPQNVWL